MCRRHLPLALAAVLALSAALAAADTPDVVYETTIGGYTLLSGRGVVVDAAGNAFVVGRWVGDQQQNNVLVAALGPDGGVLWTRAIAGQDHDHATDIALDPDGHPVICGWTDSADFPVVGGLTLPTNFRDAFVMRLDANDGDILYSTRLGGDYTDMATGLAVAPDGDLVITGWTESSDFPTQDALQDELNGAAYQFADAFVTRLDAGGQTLLYSTYLGGSHDDMPAGIALGPGGQMIIAGRTQSTDYPLRHPVQATHAGGDLDLFVTSISPGGDFLEFSTYLGGEDIDRATAIAVDPAGNVHVTGPTRSVGFPTTADAFQETFVGEIDGCEIPFGGDFNCDDAFVVKLAPDGTLAYGTYLGGSDIDQMNDLAVDAAGRACVVGYSVSSDFPPDGLAGTAAMVVRRLTADGSDLDLDFTVLSGVANAGHGIGIGQDGDLYATGAIGDPAEMYVARLTEDMATGTPRPSGRGVALLPAHPNPFNPTTELSFRLPTAASVHLRVYDARGREVAVLVEGPRAAGRHEVRWSPRDVPSGVYHARLETGGTVRNTKLVLLK